MDGGREVRIERLERRVNQLEARLRRIEHGEAMLSADEPEEPPAADAPPRPPVAPFPTYRSLHATPPAPRPVPARRSPAASGPLVPAGAISGWAAAAPPAAEPARTAWQATPPARQPISLRDLEERFAGRALAWVGGLALVAAAIFFLSLAFSRGWINEPMRVLIGLVAGMAAFSGGGVFLARRNALMGNMLTAVGLGIFSIALFAATRLYGLVVPEVGLAAALVAAIAAAAIAIRFDAREVAAFGLIAALIAPPVVGASPTLLTLAFVAVTLAGTTAIALFRSWRWLPALAFVLAAPQLASWLVSDPDTTQALVALAGFWLVNVVAAAGEEIRVRRDDLRPSSATLVLANATFLLWGGFVVLAAELEPWRGTFIAAASAAHLLLGWWFLRRQGLEHLFGNLVAGTGVALLAIASFVQLGAPAVPMAWGAEAVALAWLAARRRHRWSAVAALALGVLTVAHLVFVEYPLRSAGIPAASMFATPFAHPEAASLAAVLAAIAVAALVVPIRWVRSALAGLGVLLAAHAVTFEVTGPALAAALVGISLAGLVVDRLLGRLRTDEGLQPVVGWIPTGWLASAASVVSGAMAAALVLVVAYPPGQLGHVATTPFIHEAGASLGIVLAGLIVAGALVGVRWIRSALAGIGILLVSWALLFEVADVTLVATLALLLPLAVILDRALRWLPDDPRFAGIGAGQDLAVLASVAGAVAWGGAALYALDRYVNPTWWGSVTPPAVPLSDNRALVGALLVAAALAAARWLPSRAARRIAVVAAIVTVAVVIPFEVYADGVVVLWIALAAIAVLATQWDERGTEVLTGLASLLTVGAGVVAWGIVALPTRLWVADPSTAGRAALLGGWPLAFVAIALALYLAPRHAVFAPWRTWLELGAGLTGIYLVSIAVVDTFQRMVGGSIAVEELAKQAQVALSVCWTTIGALALVLGLARHRPMLRHAGFGLLGLATAKVFVIDLAAMDVAYRALVLAGLGLLLLLSAWMFTRFRGPRSGATGMKGGPRPAG